jgi:hypothetical protein
MSNYTITTNFGAKDSLPSGNAGKVIKGSEFTTEFTNIKTAVATKADTAGDTFTGAVTFDAAVTVNSTATITGDLTVDTNTLFVDVSENKVGIGTTSPQALLHVQDTLGSPQIKINNEGTGSGIASLMFHGGGTGNPTSIIQSGGADSGNVGIIFKHGNNGSETERMRIDSSGNVGIGTSSPDEKLVVKGGIYSANQSGGMALQMGDTSGSHWQSSFKIKSDGSGNVRTTLDASTGAIGGQSQEVISINTAGKVGIGTTSPDSIMHLSANTGATLTLESTDTAITANEVIGEIDFYSNDASGIGAASRGSISLIAQDAAGAGSMLFKTSNASTASEERMRIDSTGNVGIGTDSPACHLNVSGSGNGSVSEHVRITSTDTDSKLAFINTTGNSAIVQSGQDMRFMNNTANTERMRIDSSGNLLVGTTDSSVYDSTSGGNTGFVYSPNSFLQVARQTTTSTQSVMNLNKMGADGNIIELYKDGTSVGSIGSRSGTAVYIDSHGATGKVGLDFDSVIAPRNNGALVSSGVNLGTGSYRFQQLFVNESTSVSSDRRLKENIADADDAGNVIDSVQIRKFDWIENGKHQDYGVIAQEVLEVVPDAVQVPEDEDGRMGVSYETFIPMLIKEIQSLRSRVAELESD